ncbi:MAG: DNA mismatch repair protein MutL [Parvicella sp.]|jgi:DNA mismatch repair protein MutL
MPDIIKLLSDKIANQIAAGEVIQRPASAIKELLENAIDAGSTKVDIIVKDSGRTLIQIIDNGCGMTDTDARMSFERHATSKIRSADDLFNIITKGFRGEALASIAAIAQVELKTKTHEAELGTSIKIEGSKIIQQEPIQCSTGTNFSIKNLFFNVPARRNFLKSNAVETKHIIDEIERVALPHPEVHITFTHNGNEVFNLPSGSLRQRIVNVFGKKYNERLVPLEEKTTIMNASGYILKPEYCKRTRGEQFFFVNNRFIKSHYLNHAVNASYKELLAKEQFPSYFIFMQVNPANIDINIHPTKTEVKFEDEKSMYAIINSAVRNSLGKFNISPSLDFNQENSFNVPPIPKDKQLFEPNITVDKSFNPFKSDAPRTTSSSFNKSSNNINRNYKIDISQEEIEANLDLLATVNPEVTIQQSANFSEDDSLEQNSSIESSQYDASKTFQLHSKYILTQVGKSLLMIDQQRAHQQVLFERFLTSSKSQEIVTQKLLFPKTMSLENSNYTLVLSLLEDIAKLGFELSDMGSNTISITGVPTGVKEEEIEKVIEEFIEQCKQNSDQLKQDHLKALAWNMAKGASIKTGKKLGSDEMGRLLDELFACESPNYNYRGKTIVVAMNENEVDQKFGR